MEVAIHQGQITIDEEILKKVHFPREGNANISIREGAIKIFITSSKKKEIPEAVMKLIKHLECPHLRRSIKEMAIDSEVDVD